MGYRRVDKYRGSRRKSWNQNGTFLDVGCRLCSQDWNSLPYVPDLIHFQLKMAIVGFELGGVSPESND
jgi:hypothetical protein